MEEGSEVKMAFKLMTRKGHKQQLKELHIPLHSDLTSGLRDVRQAKLEEMKEMKEKVLGYERRQEEEAYQGTYIMWGVVPATLGTSRSGLIRGVASFQR